jgi:hypothetical protein
VSRLGLTLSQWPSFGPEIRNLHNLILAPLSFYGLFEKTRNDLCFQCARWGGTQ